MNKNLAVFLIIIAGFIAVTSSSAKVETFSLRDVDGNLVKLDDHFGKGPIVLDFWATWCKPCLKSLPKIQKIYEKFQDEGLVILGINEDGPRSLNKVEPFVNSIGITFPVLLDENRDVVRKFKVTGFPTTILLDRNGHVAMTLRGYRPGDEDKLSEKIESMLKEKNE